MSYLLSSSALSFTACLLYDKGNVTLQLYVTGRSDGGAPWAEFTVSEGSTATALEENAQEDGQRPVAPRCLSKAAANEEVCPEDWESSPAIVNLPVVQLVLPGEQGRANTPRKTPPVTILPDWLSHRLIPGVLCLHICRTRLGADIT